MNLTLTPEQKAQEGEYSLPYHYIPSSGGGFSQTLFWSWGMRYMGGLELVLSELRKLEFSSLLDVGCGDGRFLREVADRFHGKRILGVDYSSSAISLARALNPSIEYTCMDITAGGMHGRFDVATLIEVLEHIPPANIQQFLAAIARITQPQGKLLLTVPHTNKKPQAKHYQHFSSSLLRDVLSPHFVVEKIVPFDRNSRTTTLLAKLFGGSGKSFVITHKKLNDALYRRVLRHCLEPQPEDRCGRLLALATCRA